MKQIVDLNYLSNYIKISKSNIRNMVKTKQIPYFKLGNKIMFDLNEINNWIDKLEENEAINRLFL